MRGLRRQVGRCVAGVLICGALLFAPSPSPAQQFIACANPAPDTPAVSLSPEMFDDVCIPPGFGGNPIRYFDDFSWRAFLALVWPAKQDRRGEPDRAVVLNTAGRPTVFETLKAEWEVFQPDGKEPAAWNSYGGANPCKITGLAFGDVVLASFSKFASIGMAGFGPELTGALVAQNRTYVRYSIGFNEAEFAEIFGKKLYLRANLPASFSFPLRTVDIKSAWIDMTGIPRPERFHTREAWLPDLATETCSKTLVGLVGLHIVVKTASRPQWIWTTFEHVDNVPAAGRTGPFTFNDGSGTPTPATNPVAFPVPAKPPAPYNVERVKPIHASTLATNAAYRLALEAAGAKWQFYQLVMTQWPLAPFAPSDDARPSNTFPGTPPPANSTAFSNTTMETFEQGAVSSGCMNCHNETRTQTDFLFSLLARAHKSILEIPGTPPPSPGLSGVAASSNLKARAGEVLPANQLRVFEAVEELLRTKGKN